MKRVLSFGIAVLFFVTISYAGQKDSCQKDHWKSVIQKLGEYPLTGQSKQLTLPYAYNALVPAIDARTMEIHYGKHHAAYTKNMNDLSAGTAYATTPLFDLFAEIEKYPEGFKNNSGGYYNHLLFWTIMSPSTGQKPEGVLLAAINETFGSVDTFIETFNNAAKKQFGSGWAWLSVDAKGKLVVSSTSNQENPLMSCASVQGIPILALDVWEHAYYLEYQNRRPDYVTAFWTIINWQEVTRRYEEALKALK